MRKTIFILTIFLIIGCNMKENEVYILPDNYIGYVIIIFGQEEGSEKKYFNGKRIYDIPDSGILKTKFDANYGSSDFPEYYYNNTLIPFKIDWEDFSETEINATLPTVGKYYRDNGSEKPVEYAKFFVGTKSQIEVAVKDANCLDIISIADNE